MMVWRMGWLRSDVAHGCMFTRFWECWKLIFEDTVTKHVFKVHLVCPILLLPSNSNNKYEIKKPNISLFANGFLFMDSRCEVINTPVCLQGDVPIVAGLVHSSRLVEGRDLETYTLVNQHSNGTSTILIVFARKKW